MPHTPPQESHKESKTGFFESIKDFVQNAEKYTEEVAEKIEKEIQTEKAEIVEKEIQTERVKV